MGRGTVAGREGVAVRATHNAIVPRFSMTALDIVTGLMLTAKIPYAFKESSGLKHIEKTHAIIEVENPGLIECEIVNEHNHTLLVMYVEDATKVEISSIPGRLDDEWHFDLGHPDSITGILALISHFVHEDPKWRADWGRRRRS